MNHPAQGVQKMKQPEYLQSQGIKIMNYESTIKTSKKISEHSYIIDDVFHQS